MAKQAKTTAKGKTSESNNLVFVGKRTDREDERVFREPPAKLTDGRDVFKMPDAETQLAGFYHKDAARIARVFPKLYKRIAEKGDKR
jgi:hypothetical protein